MADTSSAAADLLKTYRVDGTPLYVIGTFDTGVTVFSQQIRALNLAWAAVEAELVPASAESPAVGRRRRKVAVIGAGFAGLSVTAGLLSKGADAEITVFEQRDALLPLQQGSDSRWLHPRIYDWPRKGSQASVAMLPVLNWTAARASDVVVQVLAEWKKVLTASDRIRPTLYCNARHLQIHETSGIGQLMIEWVGERRSVVDGTALNEPEISAIGRSETFDLVILAIGFGLERDGALSYWRNETIGQPSLDQPRRAFLVSGQGDGAMIDLLRLRISQYRQDRILDELFYGRSALLQSIQALHQIYGDDQHKSGLFADLESLERDAATSADFREVREDLFRRLRRDTDVILRLQVKKLSQLFDPSTARISFQNKLLVFFLYKCGGFVPSALDEDKLLRQHGIAPERVVRRHGTLRDDQLKELLSEKLYQAIETRRGKAKPDPFSQSDKVRWPGGYFDIPGKSKDSGKVGELQRAHWRKEYLPGPTQLLATAFCGALAGFLRSRHPKPGRLRVALHRAVAFGNEELLQQACDYQGTADARGDRSAAARTFPAENGTIGLAYQCRRIVRSARAVKPLRLNEAMEPLKLHAASRLMSKEVGFVLAIPLLEPEHATGFTAPSPVAGVIYVDSQAPGFFIEDKELRELVAMAAEFVEVLTRTDKSPVDRIRNVRLSDLGGAARPPGRLPKSLAGILDLVMDVEPPRSSAPLQINYDYSDFYPVQTASAK